MHFLIAGYNSLPKEIQKTYDANGIAALVGNTLFAMALVILFGRVLSSWLEIDYIEFYALIAAVLIGIPYIILKSNSHINKVDKNNK